MYKQHFVSTEFFVVSFQIENGPKEKKIHQSSLWQIPEVKTQLLTAFKAGIVRPRYLLNKIFYKDTTYKNC